MENNKVYLRVPTPRTLKDPATVKLALKMGMTVVGLTAVTVMLNVQQLEMARRFTIFAAAWLVLGAIPSMLMIFNSYVCIRDDELVLNATGLFEKRYPRSAPDRAVVQISRIEVYSGGKKFFSMPDNAAARELIRQLRLPVA